MKSSDPLNEKKLQRCFTKALGVAPETDFPKLEYAKHELWDSVAHMRLVSEIEAAFGIMFGSEDIIAMSSYPVAVKLLGKYDVLVDA